MFAAIVVAGLVGALGFILLLEIVDRRPFPNRTNPDDLARFVQKLLHRGTSDSRMTIEMRGSKHPRVIALAKAPERPDVDLIIPNGCFTHSVMAAMESELRDLGYTIRIENHDIMGDSTDCVAANVGKTVSSILPGLRVIFQHADLGGRHPLVVRFNGVPDKTLGEIRREYFGSA